MFESTHLGSIFYFKLSSRLKTVLRSIITLKDSLKLLLIGFLIKKLLTNIFYQILSIFFTFQFILCKTMFHSQNLRDPQLLK